MFFNFFLISIFSDISMIQLLFPVLAKIHLQKIVTAIALAGVFFEANSTKNISESLRTTSGRMIVFLLMLMLLSVPFSIYPGHSFRFITESQWKVLVVFFMVLSYASSKEHIEKLIWVYILSIGLLSFITITRNTGDSRFAVGGGYDPNDTALQFILALPFVFWKYRTSTGLQRIITAAICVMLLIGIVETKSRGGFLALVAVTTIIFLQLRRVQKTGIAKILISIVVLIAAMSYLGGSEYRERISTIMTPSSDYNVQSTTGRIEIWKRGIDMMIHNPLLGVGIAAFVSADGRLYSEAGARWNAAHNSFIQIGAELGFPGLLLFCFIIMGLMKNVRLIGRFNGTGTARVFTLSNSEAIFASLGGYIVGGFFLSAAYITSIYFLFALSLAFIRVESQIENASTDS